MTPQDRDYIVRTVLGEAANQSPEGQAAVASVIMNRIGSGKWGNTAQDVVLAKNQFEPWGARRQELLSINPNSPSYQRTAGLVDQIVSGAMPDPTQGATHFFAPKAQAALGRPVPKWAQGQQGMQIGDHTFFNLGGAPANAPAAIQQAAPMKQQTGAMAFSAEDDALLRMIAGQAAAPQLAPVNVPPMQTQQPSPLAGMPRWAIPASQQNGAPEVGGMTDDDLLRMIAGPAEQNRPVTKPKPAPSASGLDVAALAPTGDTLGAKAGRLGVGMVRGIGDVADTIAQGIGYAGEKGANLLTQAGVIAPETAQGVADWRSRINQDIQTDNAAYDSALGDSGAATAGRIGGNIVGTAMPAAGAANAIGGAMRGGNMLLNAARVGAQGAAAGAIGTLLTSSASEQPLADQLQTGAGVGAALGVAGPAIVGGARAATNAIMGSGIGQETAKLANAAANKFGIPLSAGQLSESPAAHFLEGVLKKLPFSGYTKHTEAQKVAFNRAVGKEFGEDVEKITVDVLANARKRIGAEYDAVEKAITLRPDAQVQNRLTQIAADARNVLDDTEWKKLTNVVGNALKDYMNTGTMTGAQYQAMKNAGSPLTVLAKSSNSDIAHYAGQVLDAMKGNMLRSAPADVAKRYAQADKQWAVLKTVEPLVGKAPTGDVSPALLRGAIGAKEIAQGKGGNLAELSQVGQRFLKEAPDSGTASRQFWQNALGAAGVTGAGFYGANNPDQAALGLGGVAAALAAGRGAGAVMRSPAVTNRMIQSGLRQPQPAANSNALLAFGNLPGAVAIVQQRGSDRQVSAAR